MRTFFETELCKTRIQCHDCRQSEEYRKGIALTFDVPSIDFDCPHGITEKNLKQKVEVGEVKPLLSGPVSLLERAFNQGRGRAEMVSEKEKKKRLSICEKCVSFIKERMRCQRCGCGLKGKLLLKRATCPDNKW